MFARRIAALGSIGAMVLVPLAGTAAHAGSKTAIDQGGAYCFRFGYPGVGATQSVLSLDIDRSDHPTKQRLWWVSGVEKATNADVRVDNYVNTLNGTATLARPNNSAPGKKMIHMTLSGTSFGSDLDAAVTGVWALDYTVRLNPKTLKGKLVGLSTFTPVAADGQPGTPVTYGVNSRVTPFSCRQL